MQPRIFFVLLGSAGPRLVSGEGHIETILQPGVADGAESAVAAGDGYFVGRMAAAPQGMVRKFSFNGTAAAFPPITGLNRPRGLALTHDMQTLFVADDAGVHRFSLAPDSWQLAATYDVAAFGVAKPNGLCLSEDGAVLVATDPGWSGGQWRPAGTNGLVRVDVATGDITTLFTDEAGFSPNGCAIHGDVVYFINSQGGVGEYSLATGARTATLSSSEDVRAFQDANQYVGDGIVLWDGHMYISAWTPAARDGKIWRCPSPGLGQCEEVEAGIVGADLQLDLRSPHAPKLIVPDLVGQAVRLVDLPPMSEESARLTCGQVRQAYQASGCCGNPNGPISLPELRRLQTDQRGPAGVLARARAVMEEVEAMGDRAQARALGEQILSIVQASPSLRLDSVQAPA